VYEIPTHLQVEDALIAGITPRQLLRLVAGASLAYAVWDQLTFLPVALRGGMTVGAAVLGVVFALVHPGDRPLDQWVFAATLFLVSPSQWRWRLEGVADGLEADASDDEWADLSQPVDWAGSRPQDLSPRHNLPIAGGWTR
jgi:hypothetical protein